MGLLDSLTQDLSAVTDKIGSMYSDSMKQAPAVPQVSGLLSQGHKQDTGVLSTGIDIAGDLAGASKLVGDATKAGTSGVDRITNTLNDFGNLEGQYGAAQLAGMAFGPEAIPIVGGAELAYDGIKYGAGLLQNQGFKGLLR